MYQNITKKIIMPGLDASYFQMLMNVSRIICMGASTIATILLADTSALVEKVTN